MSSQSADSTATPEDLEPTAQVLRDFLDRYGDALDEADEVDGVAALSWHMAGHEAVSQVDEVCKRQAALSAAWSAGGPKPDWETWTDTEAMTTTLVGFFYRWATSLGAEISVDTGDETT